MNLTDLSLLLKKLDARPKKRLSQNFLIDENVVQKIVQTAEVSSQDHILEIGPGPGALTAALLKNNAHVYAIELDSAFAKELSSMQNDKLKVFEADVLKFPLECLPPHLKIVANLPYHITTPILEKLFSRPFQSITIMVQKEVADRMSAKEGSKTFGALSLFVQFYTSIHSQFVVSANSFYPKPKVDSTVIRLDARQLPNIDPSLFFHYVHKAFQQRRKMLVNTLGVAKEQIKDALVKIGHLPTARAENLSLDQWVQLIQLLQASP